MNLCCVSAAEWLAGRSGLRDLLSNVGMSSWAGGQLSHAVALALNAGQQQIAPPCPSRDESRKMGTRKEESISALVRPPRSPPSSSGALSTGKTWTCRNGAKGGHNNDLRAGTPLL